MTCIPWPLALDCDALATADDDEIERCTELAWGSLRVLTAGRVGHCPVLLRPCAPAPCNACSSSWMVPLSMLPSTWASTRCGGNGCSCDSLSEVLLPGPAVVTEVLVDGLPLPPSAWRLDNGRRLLRTDGGVFPACQDMRLDVDKPGTFAVRYVPGVTPGVAGLNAAELLACEFAKAIGGQKCRLPSGVTTVVRQGVSMDLSQGVFPGGVTGIREVDAYVQSLNPNGLKVPPMVWSPDMAPTRYQPVPP